MKLIKKWVNKNSYILLMMLSFILLDFIMRFFTRSINFYNIFGIVPNLFTLMWVFLMVGICISLNKKVGRILYIILITISIAMFLTHTIYYSYFKNFFDFSSLQFAGEAGNYLVDAIKSSPIWIFITVFIIITISYFAVKNMNKINKIIMNG